MNQTDIDNLTEDWVENGLPVDLKRLISEETGICKNCACNWITPCVDEKHGACWWIDKHRTICSHCFYGFNDNSLDLSSLYEIFDCLGLLK